MKLIEEVILQELAEVIERKNQLELELQIAEAEYKAILAAYKGYKGVDKECQK